MIRSLLLFEDAQWRSLRPLTDLLPVPALAFGGSDLATRWRRTVGLPLLGIEARADAMRAWSGAPAPGPAPAGDGDEVVIANAAALPGPWFESVPGARGPLLLRSGDRIAAARVPVRMLAPGLGRGDAFERFLIELALPSQSVDPRWITFPWDLVAWNAEALSQDLAGLETGHLGDLHSLAALLEPARITIAEGARVDPFALLDARGGPISIETGAIVQAHTVVVGPCRIGARTQLLGGSISRSSIGPECRIAGEVEECVWQGYSNKRHHGFVGHSVIGEWVNLGALTTTSDLKNNYGSVRAWIDGREIDSGTPKLGSVIGAHVKTGIGTLLPTGATIGVGSNLFGGGRFAPRHAPAFTWWDGEHSQEHRLDAFLKTARIAMSRRDASLSPGAEAAFRRWFEATASERVELRQPVA